MLPPVTKIDTTFFGAHQRNFHWCSCNMLVVGRCIYSFHKYSSTFSSKDYHTTR